MTRFLDDGRAVEAAGRELFGTCGAEIGDWPGYGYRCGRPARMTRKADNWGGREIPVCGIHARSNYLRAQGRP